MQLGPREGSGGMMEMSSIQDVFKTLWMANDPRRLNTAPKRYGSVLINDVSEEA
jgi:hypothetical protein